MIVISGPTASGKSRAGLKLALNLRSQGIMAEVISADSAQIYRYMDIGTDKLSKEEWQGVPHHLIDIVDPDEHFDAELFRRLASEEIKRIHSENGVSVVVGGTGFWIHSLLYGLFPSPARNDEIRKNWQRLAREKGSEYLHRKLSELDPASAQRIHPNDLFRLVRALEVWELTGKTLTEHFQEHPRENAFQVLYLALTLERAFLYQRINQRVDEMLAKGFLEEVKKLREMGYGPELASQKIIGYKELHQYLDGKLSLEQAVHNIKKQTRHYARRQLVWLRKETGVEWIDVLRNEAEILEKVKRFLKM